MTIRELIAALDARFTSGNTVPVPDIRVTADEWSLIRVAMVAATQVDRYAPTPQGRAYLGGSGR